MKKPISEIISAEKHLSLIRKPAQEGVKRRNRQTQTPFSWLRTCDPFHNPSPSFQTSLTMDRYIPRETPQPSCPCGFYRYVEIWVSPCLILGNQADASSLASVDHVLSFFRWYDDGSVPLAAVQRSAHNYHRLGSTRDAEHPTRCECPLLGYDNQRHRAQDAVPIYHLVAFSSFSYPNLRIPARCVFAVIRQTPSRDNTARVPSDKHGTRAERPLRRRCRPLLRCRRPRAARSYRSIRNHRW